ncbi:hypothetical protein F0562_000878 [Nyssa sinensis]|uniref:Uncharacterized protein n=1 Tax=Nyssa sinensis TaxID=561372 RepID=A0A5J5C2Z1_9ASTE|nr:hypothetical protein F0562_000878 [Nyssa sinensis]
MPVSAHPFYPTVQSPSVATPEQYGATSAIGFQGLHNCLVHMCQVLLSSGAVPIPCWSPYSLEQVISSFLFAYLEEAGIIWLVFQSFVSRRQPIWLTDKR